MRGILGNGTVTVVILPQNNIVSALKAIRNCRQYHHTSSMSSGTHSSVVRNDSLCELNFKSYMARTYLKFTGMGTAKKVKSNFAGSGRTHL